MRRFKKTLHVNFAILIQYREAVYLIFALRDRAQDILIFVMSCSMKRCGNISTRAIACMHQVTCDWYVISISTLRAQTLSSSSSYVRMLLHAPDNPIIRRLYHKHTWYHRQSHWNVLNGTNVLTYVLFDRLFPRNRVEFMPKRSSDIATEFKRVNLNNGKIRDIWNCHYFNQFPISL